MFEKILLVKIKVSFGKHLLFTLNTIKEELKEDITAYLYGKKENAS